MIRARTKSVQGHLVTVYQHQKEGIRIRMMMRAKAILSFVITLALGILLGAQIERYLHDTLNQCNKECGP